MKTSYDICIIGAGLTGLALAYLLRDMDYSVIIIDARDRLGGRIETHITGDGTPIELGATWLGKKHRDLVSLSNELGLEIMPQVMGTRAIYEPISTAPHMIVDLPPNADPSFRYKLGSSSLIGTLSEMIKCEVILSERITEITLEQGLLHVKSNNLNINALRVVSTLPPYLLKESISIEPGLPAEVLDIMGTTHTWMGESIKVGLTYKDPFWRAQETSGTIVSNVGPVPEMYDHSHHGGDRFALKGFLNGSYASLDEEGRKGLVLNQLRKYYGDQVDTHIEYVDKVWRNEKFTHSNYTSHMLPHQNNGHPLYAQPYIDGKFWIAGSETASDFPGYMNGAVSSAKRVFDQITAFA